MNGEPSDDYVEFMGLGRELVSVLAGAYRGDSEALREALDVIWARLSPDERIDARRRLEQRLEEAVTLPPHGSRLDRRYASWIAKNVKGDGLGACREVTKAMVEAFPELRRVRGHYFDYAWGRRGHWWCETQGDEIVDPTAAQFPSKGAGEYVEFMGKDEDLPTGVCMECREPTFRGATFCSSACESSFRWSLEA